MTERQNVSPINETVEGDVIERMSGAAIEQLQRAEIDIQIATAKRYPRSITKFKQEALSMATLDEEMADSCFYNLPERDESGKKIQGPSVRLAEIVASCWGNVRVDARIMGVEHDYITARAVCFDLEKNYATSVEAQRSILKKNGGRFSQSMIATTANAAIAIAYRNAVFKVIPGAFVKPIYEQAVQTSVGTLATLVARRTKMMEYFAKKGVSPELVCAAVEKRGVDEIDLDALQTLKGLATAIKEGDISVEEAFRMPSKADTAAGVIGGVKPNGNGGTTPAAGAGAAPASGGASTPAQAPGGETKPAEGSSAEDVAARVAEAQKIAQEERWTTVPKKHPLTHPAYHRKKLLGLAESAIKGDPEGFKGHTAEDLVREVERANELPFGPGKLAGMELGDVTRLYDTIAKSDIEWSRVAGEIERRAGEAGTKGK